MSPLDRLKRLRDRTETHESIWVELRGTTISVVDPDSGRGLELCGDDSDEILITLLTDLGLEEHDMASPIFAEIFEP